MKNKLITSGASVLCMTTALLLGGLPSFDAQANTETGRCVISRTTAGDPPMSWDNGDYAGTTKYSKFGSESCDVPAGSTITNLQASFTAFAKSSVLTNGLLHGDYVLTVTGSSPHMSGSVSDQVKAIVSASNATSIGSLKNMPFNNVRLDGLNLNLSAQLQNAVTLRCRDVRPGDCEDYMYFQYTLGIDYEYEVAEPPRPPSWINASVSGSNINVNWEPISGAHYKLAIQFNNNAWTDYRYIPTPATSSSISWNNLGAGDRRYRVIACNDYGCSTPSIISNTVTISNNLPAPSTPVATLSGNTITVDWNDVPGADQYVLSIKFNNNAWTPFRYYSAPNTSQISWSGLGSGNRQYRVKACKAGICYASSGSSNVVSN